VAVVAAPMPWVAQALLALVELAAAALVV